MKTYEIIVQMADNPAIEAKLACFTSGKASADIIFLQFATASDYDLPMDDFETNPTDVFNVVTVAWSSDKKKRLVLLEYN